MDFQQIKIRSLPDRECIARFSCGAREIDKWAKEKAYKYHHQNRARVFCAFLEGGKAAIGFYSLSFSSEKYDKIDDQNRDVYRSSGVPLIYIQYLAVQRAVQGNGLGKFLLVDALRRAHGVAVNVAVYGVALRSLNERTTDLYSKFGFGVREDLVNPLMILPVWSLYDLFGKE